MEQFEKNSNYKNMVEGFMKQLITKEILYEPMKALFDKVCKVAHSVVLVVTYLLVS